MCSTMYYLKRGRPQNRAQGVSHYFCAPKESFVREKAQRAGRVRQF